MAYDDQVQFTGEDLKKWMSDFGYDKESLAHLLVVSKTAVDFWLTNKRKMPQTTIKLLLYFKRHPQRLFDF